MSDARPAGVNAPALVAPETGATLTVDLGAIRRNYRRLRAMATPAETAAVVKADAYGCGIEHVAPALAAEGCRSFFVTHVSEGIRARAALSRWPQARIFVLNGLPPGGAALLSGHRLSPVLGAPDEVAAWQADGGGAAALHVDTGINRLGLRADEIDEAAIAALSPILLMTHMACADTPDHPLNARQREAFGTICDRFRHIPASLANSAAIMNRWTMDTALARPGIALYGGRAVAGLANPMEPVVRLDSRLIQVRTVPRGETVGYGASWTAPRDTRIAVVSMGYADGYLRAASGGGGRHAGMAAVAGRHVPIVGRISMDLIAVDVTDVHPAEAAMRGAAVEMLGPNVTVDDVADAAGTIGYEVLTGLGHRYHRIVVDTEA